LYGYKLHLGDIMKRFGHLRALVIVFGALIVATAFIPFWITLPIGLGFAAIVYLRKKSDLEEKIEEIQHRLGRLRSEGLFIEGRVKGTEDDIFYQMILTLLTDLERSLYKLVEKNIQLLSLKEIGRTIISSMDEEKMISSVFDYLIRGVGYKETAFILLRKSKMQFQGFATIEKASRIVRSVVNFELKDLSGALFRSFATGKPFLIKDVKMHPMTHLGSEQLFPESTMTSYLCVPLTTSSEEVRCFESNDCALKKRDRESGEYSEGGFLSSDECLICPRIPLLGALIVTDGYRATPLTNIDQVTLETVGSLVSSNIENWVLYQELRQEEIFRENVIEGMINGVFAVDLEGRVTLANRSARDMSKLEIDELVGSDVREFIIEESPASEKDNPIFQVLGSDRALVYRDAYLRHKDGMHIPIRMNISPLTAEGDKPQGAIIEFLDMSELKRMEEEIRHLDRLAVLGRFTSSVAHEIRNPLTGIAAGIQYLNRSDNLSGDQRENISFILNEVERLNRIITDLFKIAKPRQLLYQKVDIRSLVERGYKSNQELFSSKDIGYETAFEDDLPMIDLDHDQMLQVVINLMKNSAEAVENGGKVTVRAEVYRGGDQEVIREKDHELICLQFIDNGPGIEPSDRQRVFEPFFSRKKGGTGLGLFVTHSIIQHHQGKVTLQSEEGNGTTFRVYLPISKPRKGGTS
jgi:PAS domain S-box-containing protein